MLAKTKNYRPSDKEPFMNERQREYFRAKLLAWREDILKEAKETLQHLQEENQNHPDLADRASSETDRAIELRARDRQRKLIAKIDEALNSDRRRYLWLLRRDRRTHLDTPARGAPDCYVVGRSAGTARAARACLPRRLNCGNWWSFSRNARQCCRAFFWIVQPGAKKARPPTGEQPEAAS